MCTCGGLASGVLRYDREAQALIPQVVCDQCARVLTILGSQAYSPQYRPSSSSGQSIRLKPEVVPFKSGDGHWNPLNWIRRIRTRLG